MGYYSIETYEKVLVEKLKLKEIDQCFNSV